MPTQLCLSPRASTTAHLHRGYSRAPEAGRRRSTHFQDTTARRHELVYLCQSAKMDAGQLPRFDGPCGAT